MPATPAIGRAAAAARALGRVDGAAQLVRDVDAGVSVRRKRRGILPPEPNRLRVDTRVDTNVTQWGVSGGSLGSEATAWVFTL
jgi:hypothetical protein